MKKPVQLLLFFGSAILFIVVLYFSNGGGTPPTPPPMPPTAEKFKAQIDSLSGISYDAAYYSGIKQEILGAHAATELSDEEKSGLIQSLELAKTKSLITAFDQAKSAACLSPQPLAGFVRELKGQLKLFKYPEAQVRINRYQNMVGFLGLKNQIDAFLSKEYTVERRNSLERQMISYAQKSGVIECSNCQSIKNQSIQDLEDFAGAYDYYQNIFVFHKVRCKPSMKDSFIKYKFYYTNFKCEKDV
jgi:hypothetical protein